MSLGAIRGSSSQTLDLLHNQSGLGNFSQRVIRVLEDPMEAIEGGIFSAFILGGLIYFASSIKNYVQTTGLSSTTPNFKEKIWESKKELLLSGISLAGTSANSLTWASRVRLISLGWVAPVIGGMGYVTNIILSGARIWESMQLFSVGAAIAASSESSLKQKAKAHQEQTLQLLRIAMHVTTIAWVVLGLIALCTGSSVLAALEAALLIASILFLVGEVVYRMHIKNQEEDHESSALNLETSSYEKSNFAP